MTVSDSWNVGFLTVFDEAAGFVGGYLVTNAWGRPLEFRLSSAVQPNRLQQILYAESLLPYIHGELIGKALHEKSTIQPRIVVTDGAPALELRRHLQIPVVHVRGDGAADGQVTLHVHPAYADDRRATEELRKVLGTDFDFAEPFTRIREAVAEARKLGASNRG
jgi:hypothetical protein